MFQGDNAKVKKFKMCSGNSGVFVNVRFLLYFRYWGEFVPVG